MFAYVGSRTTTKRNARGEGISVFRVAPDTGKLELVQIHGDLVNPSFLTLGHQGRVLFSVHGDEQEVSSFRVDPSSGKITKISTVSCAGTNPVHLALDNSERFLVVSNHITGTLAVLPVGDNGELGEVIQLAECTGPTGPHRVEQPFAKPHCNTFDRAGRFVLVPDKGLDRVFSFSFTNGELEPAVQPYVDAREGSGPRHLAFHPFAPYAYVVNELDSTVAAYRYDESDGRLTPMQILTTLPDSYTGNSRASEIEVARNGRYLYASNRGYDSVVQYSIDLDTGGLKFLEAFSSSGRTPRFFALSPEGKHMYVLNEDSDSIVLFSVEDASGRLVETGNSVTCRSPVCLVFSA